MIIFGEINIYTSYLIIIINIKLVDVVVYKVVWIYIKPRVINFRNNYIYMHEKQPMTIYMYNIQLSSWIINVLNNHASIEYQNINNEILQLNIIDMYINILINTILME